MSQPILLLGAGPMAIEYAKVLQALQMPFLTIGRGGRSAESYQEATGLSVCSGGYETWRMQKDFEPTRAIVAVGEKWLAKVTLQLLEDGVKTILVEKPGGLDPSEIQEVAASAAKNNAEVYIAYNRRFYASTQKAQQMIHEDGGVRSFNFEFTEWGHVLADLPKESGVKEHWFLANSTHVIDLAFYLGGKPTQISCYTAGKLDWHPNAAVYAGAGKTENAALFSYQANWSAPGRWGLEVLTTKHRFIFRPMEKLQIQKIGSVAIDELELDDSIDKQFKPGLYRQIEAFFGDKKNLPSVFEQVKMLEYYQLINAKAN